MLIFKWVERFVFLIIALLAAFGAGGLAVLGMPFGSSLLMMLSISSGMVVYLDFAPAKPCTPTDCRDA